MLDDLLFEKFGLGIGDKPGEGTSDRDTLLGDDIVLKCAPGVNTERKRTKINTENSTLFKLLKIIHILCLRIPTVPWICLVNEP